MEYVFFYAELKILEKIGTFIVLLLHNSGANPSFARLVMMILILEGFIANVVMPSSHFFYMPAIYIYSLRNMPTMFLIFFDRNFRFELKISSRKLLTQHISFHSISPDFNFSFFLPMTRFLFKKFFLLSFIAPLVAPRNIYYYFRRKKRAFYVLQSHDEYLSSFNWTAFTRTVCSFFRKNCRER